MYILKKIPALALIFLLWCATCQSSSPDWTGYESLPPAKDRAVIGQWRGSDVCTLAVIAGSGKYYFASICLISTGCCNGERGFVLQKVDGNTYVDTHRKITYAIRSDGSLRIKEPGKDDREFGTEPGIGNPSWKINRN